MAGAEEDDLATTPLIIAEAELGLADASLVVLAERLKTVQIATLDERQLRAAPPRSASQPPLQRRRTDIPGSYLGSPPAM